MATTSIIVLRTPGYVVDIMFLLILLLFSIRAQGFLTEDEAAEFTKQKLDAIRAQQHRYPPGHGPVSFEKSRDNNVVLRQHPFGAQADFGLHSKARRSRRRRRDIFSGSKRKFIMGDSLVHFSGKEVVRLRMRRRRFEMKLPAENFTAEIWARPSGGQQNPVTILSMVDVCRPWEEASGWSLGIQSNVISRVPDSTFFLRFRSQDATNSSWLTARRPYVPDRWYHLAVTYDMETVKFYVNGALVDVNTKHSGPMIGSSNRKCKEIYLGGDLSQEHFYRGLVDDFRVWGKVLSPEQIVAAVYGRFQGLNDSDLVIDEYFDNLHNWRKGSGSAPDVMFNEPDVIQHDVKLQAPPCGKTVCDDPRVIRNYESNDDMRELKRIRYRVVNVMNDDGSNPVVSDEQIERQHGVLLNSFRHSNISWILQRENVRNTSLRQKVVLTRCDTSNIGDWSCDLNCSSSRTGNDGGDCDSVPTLCDREFIGNGRCDFECNKVYHSWDGGDCCLTSPHVHLTCFDPSSVNRGYMSVAEYKAALGQSSASQLNVFPFESMETTVGLATFPWEEQVYSEQGGVLISSRKFGLPGYNKHLVHEIGHVLGLWHVHRGVTAMDCSDPCLETHPSLLLGDLCEDTNPTPENPHCRPAEWSGTYCGVPAYRDTPFDNFMGYAGENCATHFTMQQVSRMHCYFDLVYQPWSPSKKPLPLPLPLMIISSTENSVSLAWIPPFGAKLSDVTTACDLCDDFGSMKQYVSKATPSVPGYLGNAFSAAQVEGVPDSTACKLEPRMWMSSCRHRNCYIDLDFTIVMVPKRLTVWITYPMTSRIENIVLFLGNKIEENLGAFEASCAMPLTIELAVNNYIKRVRLYVTSPYMGIDAAMLSTEYDHLGCISCSNRGFLVMRTPPFPDGLPQSTRTPRFTDVDVRQGGTYNYSVVVVVNGRRESVPSSVLTYTPGQGYCGNGIVDRDLGEECDDGGLMNGDGCSTECLPETGFHCTGRPSTCYFHDGDGLCEEFERETSVKDCGYFVPEGMEDIWASSAVANPEFQNSSCPESRLLGQPTIPSTCSEAPDTTKGWHPCGASRDLGNFWLEIPFPQPVVLMSVFVHLDFDGKIDLEHPDYAMRIEVMGTNTSADVIDVLTKWVNCKENPVEYHFKPIQQQDIHLASGVRIRFSNKFISIAGVRIRSPKHWNPQQLSSCAENEVYDPLSRTCIPRVCNRTCPLLHINNGHAHCSGHHERDICTITCDAGYEVKAPLNEVMCLNGTWASVGSVQCTPIVCPKPVLPFATVVCPGGREFGSTCRFKCNPPAKLSGNDSNTVTCEADGAWSAPSALCVIRCMTPAHLVNNAALTTNRCAKGLHQVGQKCRFRCRKGYHEEDGGATRNNVEIECGEDGLWSRGHCIRTRCPKIEAMFDGLYTCTHSLFAGSVCTLRCPGENVAQVISCSTTGTWSRHFTACQNSISDVCPAPPTQLGPLTVDCKDRYVGYQCRLSCLSPFELPFLTSDVQQMAVGSPEADGDNLGSPVTQITCTAMLSWSPAPSSLTCTQPCAESAMADGWCDAANNRDVCGWDGGDCCASTSSSGEVIPFPSSCREQCTCKDPNAVEFQRNQR